MLWLKSVTASGLMERNEFYIESPYDALKVSVLEMAPHGRPRAVMYLVHGLCGCKERFIPFMEYLAGHGIACIASDHRGHGDSIRSEEDRGYMYQGGAEALIRDMDAVAAYARSKYEGVPFVLLGHSMGSLAARVYAKTNDAALAGLIICGSPSPGPLVPIGRLIVRGLALRNEGRVRSGTLQKFTSQSYNRRFRQEGYQAWTCSDPVVRKAAAGDPRCNFTITADCAVTLMQLMQEAYSRKGWDVAKPDLPMIFLSGEDDPCMISVKKFRRAVDNMRMIGYTDIKMLTYPGMRHEILNEKERYIVWQNILDFVEGLVLES